MTHRTHSILYASIIIAAGLTIRFAHLGLPTGLSKYGGSALWAAMLYWLASIAFPNQPRIRIIALATTIATAIELFKLHQTPTLDAFRLTLPGKLLLGRVFSLTDLLAYYTAIPLTACLDALSSPPAPHSQPPMPATPPPRSH